MENFGVHIGGAYESKKDLRDVIHNEYAQATPTPTKFDADFSKVPVQMQNKIGICTAEAVCSLIERFRNDGVVLSRRFTYLVGKELVDGNLTEGSSIKSMLHGAYKYGTQPESVVPTDTTLAYGDFINFNITPFLATATRILGYISVPTDSQSIMGAIYKYNGLAVRYDCGASWYTGKDGIMTWDPAKILPLQPPTIIESGHAVCLTSYDFTMQQEVDCRNSWSDKWCLGGNGYAIHSQYPCTEAYAITSTPPVIPTTIKFTSQMGYGSYGSQVLLLQKTLVQLGFGQFSPTGFFGQKTQNALVAYQMAHNIKPTGFCGPITINYLNQQI